MAHEIIKRIRELLAELETQEAEEAGPNPQEWFGLLELPELVASVVDYLQPLLLPIESAIYWYMFRHSVVENGDVHVRVSVRGLAKSTVRSSHTRQHSDTLSYAVVQKSLIALRDKGVVAEAGDTNRDGTLYRIYLPEEIGMCRDRIATMKTIGLPKVDIHGELDFYNIKENRQRVFERDGYKCHYCGKQLTRFSATLDHIVPISTGGDNSYDNLITACLHCNSQRRASPVMDQIARRTTENAD
ncbi:MAG: HNH endonuclease [Chloroflexota bacterium]|nr:HNH endonuclease [Chloroflexota bacterium]